MKKIFIYCLHLQRLHLFFSETNISQDIVHFFVFMSFRQQNEAFIFKILYNDKQLSNRL